MIDPAWADRNVSFHVPDPASGLAHDLFRHVVLKNRSFREGIVFQAKPGDLLRSLPANGLGFVPWSALAVGGSAVRVVPIAVAADGAAHGPDAIALHRGDYPLRLPLWLVFRSANAAQLRPLLQALLAEEGAALATAAGFVPLPPDVRREVAVDLAKEPGRQISASEK